MHRDTLERLLTTLDVALHGFAVCNVAADQRLVFEPMNMVVVHYILRGRGYLETPIAEPRPFGPGHIVVVPAGAAQSLRGAGAAVHDLDAAEHCAMLVDGLVRFGGPADDGADSIMTICSTISATYGGSFGLFDRLIGPIVRDMEDVAVVRAAFDQLLAERMKPDIGTHALTEAIMKQCLVLFVRAELRADATSSPLFAGLTDPRLAAAVTDVLQAPAAARSVKDLADVAGMSRSAFAAHFAETFGQSPMDFVQKARLHHATKLLTSTGLPVKVIAGSMGFRSRSHFSHSFSRAYGVDPSRYRKEHQNRTEDAPSASGRSWLTRMTSDSIEGADD